MLLNFRVIPVSKFTENNKFSMATYTPYVDLAVKIGDIFGKATEATGDSITDSNAWEGATLGINVSAIASIVGFLGYLWKQLKTVQRVRNENYLAMEPQERGRLQDAENQQVEDE